ncbi:MAG: hypothetical protein U1F48_17425 [Burkholderiales bacterium]
MFVRRAVGVLSLALPLVAGVALGQGFKFSNPDPDEQAARAQQAAREDRIAYDLSTPCRADLKGKKIMVVIGERRSNGYVDAEQQNYGPVFDAINNRLRGLGLRTYTPEEIRAQIAQAEIDAYFKNNPDLALSAAKRLGASFVLRGLITSEATMNNIIAVNQVAVTMGFTLTGSNGRLISEAGASSASYAGANVTQMALTLVNEQADEVVARLYGDYCRNAGLGLPAPKGKGK